MRHLLKKIRQRKALIAAKKTLLEQQTKLVKSKIMIPALIVTAISGGVLMTLFRRHKLKKKTQSAAPERKPAATTGNTLSFSTLMQGIIAATTLISTLVSAKEIATQLIQHLPIRKSSSPSRLRKVSSTRSSK